MNSYVRWIHWWFSYNIWIHLLSFFVQYSINQVNSLVIWIHVSVIFKMNSHLTVKWYMNSSIAVLDEFIWFASLDEITEFNGYLNSYIKWKQLINEFIYSILPRNTLVSFLYFFFRLILERWETQLIVLTNFWPYYRIHLPCEIFFNLLHFPFNLGNILGCRRILLNKIIT